MDWSLIGTATGASAAAGLATAAGALPVLAIGKISNKLESGFLGIAAVSYSSVLLPWGLGFTAGR